MSAAPSNGTALANRVTVMGAMAERYSMNPTQLFETIKATCIKGNASIEQVQAFLIVANKYGLDPFLKEIHAFAGQGGGIVPIVGVDGWSRIANSTGAFDGVDFSFEGDGQDMSCTCTVHVKGRSHPTIITEYMAECGRNTQPWKQYPRRMLRHKAFMQCVRIAFGLGGIYDEDEARDVLNNEGGEPTPVKGKVDALNAVAKAKAHPTDPEKSIDTTTSNEQFEGEEMGGDEDHGQEQQEQAPTPDVSSWATFFVQMESLAQASNVQPSVFAATMNALKLTDAGSAKTALGPPTRKRLFEAAWAGGFDWQTGKIVD